MGTVNFGAPKDEILYLKRELGLSLFFEGGTYRGGTALFASDHFEKVITVEKSPAMQEIAAKNISQRSNIELMKGDSREHLPAVLAKHDHILFWLDAHWSGGQTYGEKDECPLLDELATIFAAGKDTPILVDDARLFLAPPPLPHDAASWPNIREVVNATPKDFEIFVFNDVIYIIPMKISGSFRDFLQIRAGLSDTSGKSSLFKKMLKRAHVVS